MSRRNALPGVVRPLLIGVLALAPVLVAGCSTDAPRDSAGVVTAAATSDAFSVKVGDCIGKVEGETADSLPLVPCAEKHNWEAFAASELAGTDFPGNTGVQSLAEEACRVAFVDFVGIEAGDSKYELQFLTPTKESWNEAGDREVVCLVGNSGGGITGSLKGVKK